MEQGKDRILSLMKLNLVIIEFGSMMKPMEQHSKLLNTENLRSIFKLGFLKMNSFLAKISPERFPPGISSMLQPVISTWNGTYMSITATFTFLGIRLDQFMDIGEGHIIPEFLWANGSGEIPTPLLQKDYSL